MSRLLPVALALALLPALALADITGPARVIDGDTLEVRGEQIRLHGIDAPESAQNCKWKGKSYPCGEIAGGALKDLTAGIEVRCEQVDVDRYGRIVTTCYDNHDFSINRNMVYTGWALAYRRYSTRYLATEDSASEAKRGLWKGEFVVPWEWRQGKRLQAATVPESATSCVIKGNISSKGERIYHVPGGRWYDRTKISTAKGERWFCAEADAQAAGWRRSLR